MPGSRSWLKPASPASRQRGGPMPLNTLEARQGWRNDVPMYGRNITVRAWPFSLGAAAWVQNYGKVLTNPIGAGVVALSRPQASYGPSGQYVDHTIWWAQQTVPTSVQSGPLMSPEVMQALLGRVNVQAAVRVG